MWGYRRGYLASGDALVSFALISALAINSSKSLWGMGDIRPWCAEDTFAQYSRSGI